MTGPGAQEAADSDKSVADPQGAKAVNRAVESTPGAKEPHKDPANKKNKKTSQRRKIPKKRKLASKRKGNKQATVSATNLDPKAATDYGPEGSRLTVFLKTSVFRDPEMTVLGDAVLRLLGRLPDYRNLVAGGLVLVG